MLFHRDFNRRMTHRLVSSLLFALIAAPAPGDEGMDFFENKIRPILVNRCYECHSEQRGKQKAASGWTAAPVGRSAATADRRWCPAIWTAAS